MRFFQIRNTEVPGPADERKLLAAGVTTGWTAEGMAGYSIKFALFAVIFCLFLGIFEGAFLHSHCQ